LYPKKEQKGSKGKADSHRTAQPKAYGIMAGQKGGFAQLLCDCPATLRDLFRFLLVLPLSALLKWLSFFSVFLFWKQFFRGFYGYIQSVEMHNTTCVPDGSVVTSFSCRSCGARKRSKKNTALLILDFMIL